MGRIEQKKMSNKEANRLMKEAINRLKSEGCDNFADRFNGPLGDTGIKNKGVIQNARSI